jgi:hypothetical protein
MSPERAFDHFVQPPDNHRQRRTRLPDLYPDFSK